MGKQSWEQEIVALAKLCFGKNSKRIKSDYCLSHEIAEGGREGEGANLRIWENCLKRTKFKPSSRKENQINLSERQNQTIGIQNTGRPFAMWEPEKNWNSWLALYEVALSVHWKVDKLNSGWKAPRMECERWRKYMMLPGSQAGAENLNIFTQNKQTQ